MQGTPALKKNFFGVFYAEKSDVSDCPEYKKVL